MPLDRNRPRIRPKRWTVLRVGVAAAVFFLPGLILMGSPAELLDLTAYDRPWELPARILILFALSWKWIWTHGSSVQILLTLLLLFCGGWAWHLLGAKKRSACHQS